RPRRGVGVLGAGLVLLGGGAEVLGAVADPLVVADAGPAAPAPADVEADGGDGERPGGLGEQRAGGDRGQPHGGAHQGVDDERPGGRQRRLVVRRVALPELLLRGQARGGRGGRAGLLVGGCGGGGHGLTCGCWVRRGAQG